MTIAVPDRPRVLFVDHDAGSPQIAASLLKLLAADRVSVDTACTRPHDAGGRSDEMLVAMGLDPAEDHRLTARALRTADRVVSLDVGLDVARLPGPRYEEWDLSRGDLTTLVPGLSDELTTSGPPAARSTVLGRLRAKLMNYRSR